MLKLFRDHNLVFYRIANLNYNKNKLYEVILFTEPESPVKLSLSRILKFYMVDQLNTYIN